MVNQPCKKRPRLGKIDKIDRVCRLWTNIQNKPNTQSNYLGSLVVRPIRQNPTTIGMCYKFFIMSLREENEMRERNKKKKREDEEKQRKEIDGSREVDQDDGR